MTLLGIYLPKPGLLQGIIPGSAIVGSEDEEWKLRLDFEGNKYGTPINDKAKFLGDDEYEYLLFRAVSRHLAKYPTIARTWVTPDDVIQVGELYWQDYEYQFGWIVLYGEHEELFKHWRQHKNHIAQVVLP